MKNKYENLVQDSIELILQHFFKSPEEAVQEYISANDLQKKVNFSFSQKGVEDNEFITLIEQILKYSPDTQHPGFGARLYAGILPEAFVGQVLSIALNLSLGPYHASQIGAVVERKCIEMLCGKLGFENGDGVMTPGGLFANAEALHLARYQKFPHSKESGMKDINCHVYVSDQAHYSFKKSAPRLGIGTDNIIEIQTDSLGCMCVDDLDRKIKLSIEQGHTPLMIVSTAGTTVLGAFDPINQINLVAEMYGIWHHVDLIWGAAVSFSDRMDYISGIKFVNSVAFNAHKTLGTGISTSFLLINNQPELMINSNGIGGKKYLNYKTGEDDYFATGDKSQQCGRPNDAFAFFFALKSRGFDGYKELIDNYFALSGYFADSVKAHDYLKLFAYNEYEPYLNVCVQVCDASGNINGDLTHQIQEYFTKEHPIWLVEKVVVKDAKVLRFVFVNSNLTKEYIDYFFKELDKVIQKFHMKEKISV